MLSIRIANPGRGAAWLLDGFEYFRQCPGAWIGTGLILIGITVFAGFVPFAGLAMQLLTPVFLGGLMLGCREIEGGGILTINHLFAGFSRDTGNLLLLGVFYTLGVLIIMIAMSIVLVSTVGMDSLRAAIEGNTQVIAENSRDILLMSLVGLMFYLPLLMAFWFGPVLVVLEGQSPLDAIKNSFMGCLKNIVPFLVYGLVGLALAFVATVPFLLGWFILMPMTVASFYLAYREIYQSEQVAVPA